MPDREKVIDGLCAAIGLIHGYIPKSFWADGYEEQACRDAIALLKEQENLDNRHKILVEKFDDLLATIKEMNVVLCKDCKHLQYTDGKTAFCHISDLGHDYNWFCADGERK